MDRRDVLTGALWVGAGMKFLGSQAAFAEATGDASLLETVHPQLRPLVRNYLSMMTNLPVPTKATLAEQRAKAAAMTLPKPPADISYEKKSIPGRPGQPDVVIHVVNARQGPPRPAILHTHGGGFTGGSAAGSILFLAPLSKQLDCVAVSVEYRLAPEVTYTGSIEDNYAGLKWLHDNAEQLGVDPARIALMGESAGGGHAAMLAIAARDRGEVKPAFQCLTYPMLDDRTGTSRQVPPTVGRLAWTPALNRFGWESFLGMKAGGRGVPAAAVPARTQNLAGLPPAWIGVGSIDLFHDEDVDYAQRLNNAGVPTELIVVPGAFHGFDLAPVPISRWFVAARVDALKSGLGIA